MRSSESTISSKHKNSTALAVCYRFELFCPGHAGQRLWAFLALHSGVHPGFGASYVRRRIVLIFLLDGGNALVDTLLLEVRAHSKRGECNRQRCNYESDSFHAHNYRTSEE